jgi:hypothetical protein
MNLKRIIIISAFIFSLNVYSQVLFSDTDKNYALIIDHEER